MARRPKQQSILDIAIAENWKVSASFAIVLFVIILVVIPTITNPILKAFSLALKPVGLILAFIFVFIAIVKFLRQTSSDHHYGLIQHKVEPKLGNWNDAASPTDETSDKEREYFLLRNRERGIDRPTELSLKLIQDIEWKRFEELSTAYYVEKGIRAEATSLGADGGIDIKLYQDDSGRPTSIVQCKAWKNRFVGVKEIREFLGVMTHEKIDKAFYMTSGEYSDEAKETAKANRITLINGELLLMMIKRLPQESQKRLLALATEGDYTTPSCPSCGVKMIKRSGKRGGFWGCKNYPRCRQMLHLRSEYHQADIS